MRQVPPSPAELPVGPRTAYDALAPFYDSFTHDYAHEEWLDGLETWAQARGLRGRDLLDVGCGTGKSFLPFLPRGYRVTACDLSPEMVDQARAKVRDRAEVVVADMRALPWVARFDLITCLDDAMNYLLRAEELKTALRSMWVALRPGGILLFDTNSLSTYRDAFATAFERDHAGARFRWRGLTSAEIPPGSVCEATLEVSTGGTCVVTRHVQRHWQLAVLRGAVATAGFEYQEFRGQRTGGLLVGSPDEEEHAKIVCLARKPIHAPLGTRVPTTSLRRRHGRGLPRGFVGGSTEPVH